jgi:hypothetical protein
MMREIQPMPPAQTNPYEAYTPQPVQPPARRRKRVTIFVGLILSFLILFTVVSLLFSKATIAVNVRGPGTGEITYRFVNQTNPKKVVEVKDTAKSKSVSLPKGIYEITVQQGQTSYFAVAKASGGTTTIDTTLEAERGRRFVGNQPKDCFSLLRPYLISYDCNGTTEAVDIHVPATATLPTYNQRNPAGNEDVIEGFVHTTTEGDVLLAHEAEVAGHEEFDPISPHRATILKNGLTPNVDDIVGLEALAGETRYKTHPYREGFLVYNMERFNRIFYFGSVKTKPTEIVPKQPSDTSRLPYALATRESSIAVAYSKEKGANPKIKSTVVVQLDSQAREYEFDKSFQSIRLCSPTKLCTLSESNLEVYDISSENADLVYEFGGVQAIENFSGGFLVVRSGEVLKFDADKQGGTRQYSFGDHEYCGIQPTSGSYLICLENSPTSQAVILLDQQQESDGIDQKVAELRALPEVSAVSVYGPYISITPNAGKLEYQPAKDSFGYDPATIRNANAKITQKLQELAIDQTKYQINNTLD